MADESYAFALDLEGNAAAFAQQAAGSLDSLQESIQGDIAALRGMQQAMRQLQSAGVVNVATARQLRDQITAQKAKVAAAQQAYVTLGGTFRGIKKPTAEAKEGLKEIAASARAMPGPLGEVSGKLTALNTVMKGSLAGPFLLAAGLAALTVALGSAAVALGLYGIRQADARRSELLHLEGLTKLRYGMFAFYNGAGRAAMSATQLQGAIDEVSASVPLARAEVGKWEEQLYKMGLRGANLQYALKGAAITASAQGDAAAQSFANWAAGANLVGQSVKRLSEDAQARLGGIVEKQMLSLDVISLKLHENLDALFRDIKIEGFLHALKDVADLFSQQHASGRALKHLLDTLFSGLNSAVSPIALVVKRFFQGLIIGALLVERGFLKLRRMWISVFGDKSALANIQIADLAVWAGVAAVFALAGAAAIAAIGIAAMIAPLALIAYGLYRVYQAALLVKTILESIDWSKAGGNITGGLVAGIQSGGNPVIAAAQLLAKKAINAFNTEAQIHSPSRLTFKAGGYIAAGAAVGIRAGIPAVRAQARAMARAPAVAMRAQARIIPIAPFIAARAAAVSRAPSIKMPSSEAPEQQQRGRGAAAAGGGPSVVIKELNIHGAKADSPDDFAARAKEALERELRGIAISIGAKDAAA